MPSSNSTTPATDQPAALRIGVTGHRFLVEHEKLADGLHRVCERIEICFPGRSWTVISSLAEGTDRIVAAFLLEKGADLIAPLPFPIEAYLEDFPEMDSRQAFLDLLKRAREVIQLPDTPVRKNAYRAVGQYILEHCDLLLAVWDGQEAQGKGGTGAIVAGGRQRKIPLAWLHAGNRKPGTHEPVSLGAEQGTVTFERL